MSTIDKLIKALKATRDELAKGPAMQSMEMSEPLTLAENMKKDTPNGGGGSPPNLSPSGVAAMAHAFGKDEDEPHKDDPHHEEKEKKKAKKIKEEAESILDMHKAEKMHSVFNMEHAHSVLKMPHAEAKAHLHAAVDSSSAKPENKAKIKAAINNSKHVKDLSHMVSNHILAAGSDSHKPGSLKVQKGDDQDEMLECGEMEKAEILSKPPVSQAQRGAMWAAAEGKSNLGIPKSVGKDFADSDAGGKLPEKAKKNEDLMCSEMIKGHANGQWSLEKVNTIDYSAFKKPKPAAGPAIDYSKPKSTIKPGPALDYSKPASTIKPGPAMNYASPKPNIAPGPAIDYSKNPAPKQELTEEDKKAAFNRMNANRRKVEEKYGNAPSLNSAGVVNDKKKV